MPNPVREMDVVSEKQVKCLCTNTQTMDHKRKSGILIAGAKCEAIRCRNNRKCNQDQNTTVFGKGKNRSKNDGQELNMNNIDGNVIRRNSIDSIKSIQEKDPLQQTLSFFAGDFFHFSPQKFLPGTQKTQILVENKILYYEIQIAE